MNNMINSLTTHLLKDLGYLDAQGKPESGRTELLFSNGGDIFKLSSLAGIHKLRQQSVRCVSVCVHVWMGGECVRA